MTGTWATGWATGDVEVAAEFKKGIGNISDTTLGGSAANVDITSISATYAHLLLVIYARGDAAAASVGVNLRFNGDSTANYDLQQLFGAAATMTSGESFAGTAINVGSCAANTAGANLLGACIVFIPNYAGSTNNKLCVAMNAWKTGVSTGNMTSWMSGGFWRSAAAINRVTVLPGSGNFVTGTRVTLYGMGA